jgi:argininosuccinate lyase
MASEVAAATRAASSAAAAPGQSAAGGSGGSSEGPRLWGGRFTGATDPLMEAFNNSLRFDRRLWAADIKGSIAYARALGRAGLLKQAEVDSLVEGLNRVRAAAVGGAGRRWAHAVWPGRIRLIERATCDQLASAVMTARGT